MEILCFAYPERLSVLFLLLPLAGVLGWGMWRKFHARKLLADDRLAIGLLGRWKFRKEIAIQTLQFFAAGLLFIAWCGPRLCSGEKLVRREAFDIVYVLDVSNSMLARDVTPDRLERARQEVLSISREIERGRRGLVAFGGSSVVLCPLTTDRQAFETMLNIVSPDLIEYQGTNVGEALDMASRMLSARSRAEGLASVRTVVLVSDGENHGKKFSGEARRLREKDIQLIVIGVGMEVPTVIPLQNDSGESDSIRRDAERNPVLTSFRPELLGTAAEKAEGMFLHSSQTELVSGRVLEMLKLKEADTQWLRESRYREKIYHYFLLASVVFLLGAGVLSSKY